MKLPYLTSSIRVRRSPFNRCVEAEGVKAFSVYNHMMIPQLFRSVEEDHAHLKSAVQVWDVACERQVEIIGPDAKQLVQMTTPRDLSGMEDDQCYYIPMVDEQGMMLNDPIAIKLSKDRYWLSLADSDMLYYCKGLASGFKLNVSVFEPDVSPLAIQGPKADELVVRVFGEDIINTRFFRFKWVKFEGRRMVLSRSGWSHQGGFELYLDGSEFGEAVWDAFFEAGKDLDVRAGCPNLIERIESGLLSYGSDITIENTPMEAGLTKYCILDRDTGCLGHQALLEKREPVRQNRAIEIEGPAVPTLGHYWPLKDQAGRPAGRISSATWSPDFQTNVAIGMVQHECWAPGTELEVETPDWTRTAKVRDKFWI